MGSIFNMHNTQHGWPVAVRAFFLLDVLALAKYHCNMECLAQPRPALVTVLLGETRRIFSSEGLSYVLSPLTAPECC